MTGLGEIKANGYMPQRAYIALMARGGWSLSKVILFNMRELKRLRVVPAGEERHVRPARQYEIPPYQESMRTCRSQERYLRPTLYCDPNDPAVIAIADQLGAFKVSDREFAEAAYHFVKERMLLEEMTLNDVGETFQRGTGTCFHLITAFIALCRCAGIKARYKIFAMNMIRSWYDVVIQPDPFIKKWYDSLGFFVLEGEGEVLIDGEWLMANVGPEAEWQAATGTPITRLGEGSLGNWFNAVPGTEMRMESIPYGLGASLELLHAIAPGSMERVNISMVKQKERGSKVIAEAGGLEAYDRMARLRQGPRRPKMRLEPRAQIVFDE
jgi:hypothetical protein